MSASRLAWLFSRIAVLLVVAHIVLQSVRFWSGNDFLMGFLAAFALGAENNFPTYFSTFALFVCSALLAAIAIGERRQGDGKPIYWIVLSAIFMFLSMDEMMSVHERLSEPVKGMIGETDVFYYAWVLPYGVLLAIFVAVYYRFLNLLPRRTALLFLLSGALFVGGAIGFETLSGYYYSLSGSKGITYVILQTLEEILEITGTILFIYALAEYAEQRFGVIDFCLMPDKN
jgi:hypothetical protein